MEVIPAEVCLTWALGIDLVADSMTGKRRLFDVAVLLRCGSDRWWRSWLDEGFSCRVDERRRRSVGDRTRALHGSRVACPPAAVPPTMSCSGLVVKLSRARLVPEGSLGGPSTDRGTSTRGHEGSSSKCVEATKACVGWPLVPSPLSYAVARVTGSSLVLPSRRAPMRAYLFSSRWCISCHCCQYTVHQSMWYVIPERP